MAVAASAPGKLVLAGDYAVLEGAPALVMALDRRARACVAPGDDDLIRVEAADIGLDTVRGRLHDDAVEWLDIDAASRQRLRLVAAVLERQARSSSGLAPARIRLDTGAFFDADAGGKLGLGSSAALTVALAAALARANGTATPSLEALIGMQRSVQSGRGSGVDLAASLAGGVLAYRLAACRTHGIESENSTARGQIFDDSPADSGSIAQEAAEIWTAQADLQPVLHESDRLLEHRQPELTACRWPPGLHWRLVWSGRGASTAAALARLAEWRRTHPATFRQSMHQLCSAAVAVEASFRECKLNDVLGNLAMYADRLDDLGKASGIDIVCAEHRQIIKLAADHGVVYKTCGAGGGDVGVALAADNQRLADFTAAVCKAGFAVLDAALDPDGVRHENVPECSRRNK